MNAPESKTLEQAERADVSMIRGGFSTEYRISGSLPEVFSAIEGLFVNYHPMGYGTFVHSIEMKNDGRYAARVSRANSCD